MFIWCIAAVLILGFALLAYGIFIEPHQVAVRHVYIKDSTLSEAFGDKTVIHISDLHIQEMGSREKKVLRMVEELKPGVVFLTGDYVRWKGSYDGALEFLATLSHKAPAWGVLGDYDYSRSRKSCLFCHEHGSTRPATGHTVKFLRNSAEKMDAPYGTILVGGIDLEGESTLFLRERLRSFQDRFPSIILSHSPLVFDFIDDSQNVLILSGDTHGGQIMLPGWVWKALGYAKNSRYEQGYFERGSKKMYVTRGIGTSHVPIRILRNPEIVVFHFSR